MATTPVYGWPTPDPSAAPDVPADMQDLADAIDSEVNRVESTVIGDIDSRLAIVEAAVANTRWRHIDQGQNSGANFSIPVPAGFELLHLRLWGDLEAAAQVQLRINGDTAAGLHRQGFVVQDSQTPPDDDDSGFIEDTSWYLADWATVEGNTAEVTVFNTLDGARVSYQSYGGRSSLGGSAQRRSFAHGMLTADRVVSSLEIVAGASIAAMKWWLDGRLAP